jgi:nicotinate-nucleotide pyrophosphorylase (carboxylating)
MTWEQVWANPQIKELIALGIREDIGTGDHSTLASISESTKGSAKMIAKQDAYIAGIPLAIEIFHSIDPALTISVKIKEGAFIRKGEIIMEVYGNARSILSAERLVLNFIQRMSGITTLSQHFASIAKSYRTKILDTRKTTPGHRLLEKYAVNIGGCSNHRIGLYDMIMLKDNHIDFCGGIEHSINKTKDYLKVNNLNLKIEIETRSLQEVQEVLSVGGVDVIMLDNFNPTEIQEALKLINGAVLTEASGGISEHNLVDYLKTGVDFISIGALTHSSKNIDISLKTVLEKK